MNQTKKAIRDVLKKSGNIVVLSGLNVVKEAGLNGIRAEHIAYDIEDQYGYSNDEIISSAFYFRRADIFYDYYKNIILNKEEYEPTTVHKAVYKLQKEGKLSSVITRTVYGLYKKAGCKNVLEMHGSAEENRCPACGKVFGIEHVKKATGVPVCDECRIPLRPGFSLLGETIDNGKVTKSCNEVENANVLLIIGASIREPICQHVINYYEGSRMILINTKEQPGDERADYRIYGDLSELVSYVTDYEEEETEE